MALAITSFPVPVSPWIKTAESTGAIMFIWLSKARNFGLDPIKSKVVKASLLYQMRDFVPRFRLIKTGARFATARYPRRTPLDVCVHCHKPFCDRGLS